MDEVEALSKTIEMGRPRWGAILPTLWWSLEDSEWHVTFSSDVTFRFRQSDGQFVDDTDGLDAITAFRIARNHALQEEARWAPAISISRKTGEWHVSVLGSHNSAARSPSSLGMMAP